MNLKLSKYMNYFFDPDSLTFLTSLVLSIGVLIFVFWDSVVSQLWFITDFEKISILMATISIFLGLLAGSIHRNNMLMKKLESQLELPFEIKNTFKDFQ